MNSNFILIILVLIIIYLYYNPQVEKKSTSVSTCKISNKINPKDFNPAIHHPAAL